MSEENFQQWCILELMGHRRLFGFVTEVQIGGASFLRLDVPATMCEGDGDEATQYYSPSAVYCITPTTEKLARKMAMENKPEPVTRWELKGIEAPRDRVDYRPDVEYGTYIDDTEEAEEGDR